MLTKKLETETTILKSLIGIFLKKGEKNRLHDICVKHKISIPYPELFKDDLHYYLWGLRDNKIGLIGTVVMNHLSENGGTIFQSLDELEAYLKGE